VKLLRTIRLDPSDTFVFERAAEPGEWAVSGSFMFAEADPEALEGKRVVTLFIPDDYEFMQPELLDELRVLGDAQFLRAAEHALTLHATQLADLDLHATREHRSRKG